ncbi:MAG: rRNA maturation RNase YbeY [Elainella sp.]
MVPLQVEVTVQEAEGNPASPIDLETWKTWFQRWLEVLQPLPLPSHLPKFDCFELCLRLTDNAEIQALNAQYRHKDQPTDVLAFAALEVAVPPFPLQTLPADFDPDADMDLDEDSQDTTPPEPLYLGDIVISVETAQRQADQRQHPLQQELAWLAAHALLHLLGWDHPDEASLLTMLQQQEVLLQTVGIPSGYYQESDFLPIQPR